ncbi:hypothetical protein M758_1G280600 [Ceratodon purpureus]|nr:hypothetical protein M758_1G280600 [Ceratodon purpureus]
MKSLQEKAGKHFEVSADLPKSGLVLADNRLGTVESDIDGLPRNDGSEVVFEMLSEKERVVLDCAVKEYLMAAGYKIAAMTFQEEVNLDLDSWPHTAAHVPEALRQYYRAFLASTVEARQDKDVLQKEKDALQKEIDSLLKEKEVLKDENSSLMKSVENLRRSLKEKDRHVQQMKELLENSTTQLNEYRVEVTSLKLELENLISSTTLAVNQKQASAAAQLSSFQSASESECEETVAKVPVADKSTEELCVSTINGPNPLEDRFTDLFENSSVVDSNGFRTPDEGDENGQSIDFLEHLNNHAGLQDFQNEHSSELGTVHILADALPKIAPFVLINHREELLPLISCAIEKHPDCGVRDSLTHLLFNLIKKPDEAQRRNIMDACVELSRNVGQLRTETELLPQCWEQIDHKYEERRLLVAQSCGELGQMVGSEMRASLILSIIEQLVADQAPIVRKAAAHNLAILLPRFSNFDKYSKVEALMLDLTCDPVGPVVDTTLKEVVPALVAWIKREKHPLTHLYRGVTSRLLSTVQRCPPISEIEGTVEAELRALGERRRWNIDVLLRLLAQLLTEVQEAAIKSCPFSIELTDIENTETSIFTEDIITLYIRSSTEWPILDWLLQEFFPALLQLARMLPCQEESLRTHLCKVLHRTGECFGSSYVKIVMLPIFLSASGDEVEYSQMSKQLADRIKGFKPRTLVEEQLAVICILPLLLVGVLGAPGMEKGQLATYLRDLILKSTMKIGAWTSSRTPELIDSVRFLCKFEQHLAVIVGVLWELIVSPNADVKVSAAVLSKLLVGRVMLKSATQQIIPALVTLGTDPNVDVKIATIDAFGAVAQRFKEEEVVDKVKMQLDAFLEDGSHAVTNAVIRALSAAVSVKSPSLQDYLLKTLVHLSELPMQNAKLFNRQERADVICEAFRAFDVTDLSAESVNNLLLPTIKHVLKNFDTLDPAQKESLELIIKDCGSTRVPQSLSKSVSISRGSLFGEGGFLKDPNLSNGSAKLAAADTTQSGTSPAQEDSGLKRMMRMSWGR